MPRNYDNWERLVAAVLKRDELWHLFHAQSSTSESSSGLSLGVDSPVEDEPLSNAIQSPTHNDDFRSRSSTSRVHVKDDLHLPQSGNQSFTKTVTSEPFWKRAFKIEIPKLRSYNHGTANITSQNDPKTSPGPCPSPSPSPRTTLVTPGSSDRSASVTPPHSRHGTTDWPDSAAQKSSPLPLPLPATSNSSSELILDCVKKGKLLSRSATGDVYHGFNSARGAMCAMKEVSLSSSPESKQIARALEEEIRLLSTLSHPNILQYYGSEMAVDRFYIYCEYVSAGSVVEIMKQYGRLGEPVIRRYTKQILSGLAYLHSKNIAHEDIRESHILVGSNGIVKLSSFGTLKHLSRQLQSPMLMDSPYRMAPEDIMNPETCRLQMDIWSLGCTVVEMATSTQPMSPYEGIKAIIMFKTANENEIPAIPEHLSEEGKDFLRHCFQWNPVHRATTASQLLEHPFVRSSFREGGVTDEKNDRQLDPVLPAVHMPLSSKSSNHQHMPDYYSNVNGHTPRKYVSAYFSACFACRESARNPLVTVISQSHPRDVFSSEEKTQYH